MRRTRVTSTPSPNGPRFGGLNCVRMFGRSAVLLGIVALAYVWYTAPGEAFFQSTSHDTFWLGIDMFVGILVVATFYFFPEIYNIYREGHENELVCTYEFRRRSGALRRKTRKRDGAHSPTGLRVEESVALSSFEGLTRISSSRFHRAWALAHPARGLYDEQILFSLLCFAGLAVATLVVSAGGDEHGLIVTIIALSPIAFCIAQFATMMRIQTVKPSGSLRALSFFSVLVVVAATLMTYFVLAFAGLSA